MDDSLWWTTVRPNSERYYYDELSIPAIRARLSGLSVALIKRWVEYEKTHAARDQVINMFERRIAKLETDAQMDTRTATQKTEGFTYLVYSPGLKLHKIGTTTNVAQRLKGLYGGCPDVRLVTSFPYGYPLEQHLHWVFGATRLNGCEWFKDITETAVKGAVVEWESDVTLH